MFDIPSGFTGFTIDVFGGSTSDSEGDVTKALFAITYQERINNVDFQITNGPDDWSVMMPTGEYIGLKNPKVIFVNRDASIVQFDMDEKYPSNTFANLCYRSQTAKFSVNETDEPDKPFVTNTIIGAIGFTSNEYGGATDDHGQVARVLFNIAFPNRKNEVEFTITEDPDDWAVLMGDGSYINLINPHVLFQNRNGATIVFQMKNVYPAGSPGFLVRRRKEASYTITEIDEDHPFIPVQQIVFSTYLPAGERINLHTQSVVYPMNSTLRGIEWSLVSPGSTNAEITSGWITTVNPGKVILRATIPSGNGLNNDYTQDIEVMIIDNWIIVDNQPHLDTAVIAGKIDTELNVIAKTIFGELTYQWYRNTAASNDSGVAISGAQGPAYKIPKGLVPGEYYYFCEIRKVNFPSVRTDVATVRVRDELVSLDIYPPAASIPPGTTQQFAVTRNPQTSDELAPVSWHSDNHHLITIDQNGLARSHNPGIATISASIGNVTASIKATTIYTPVQSIVFDFESVLDTGITYTLPKKVEPANATYRDIIWTIVSAGTTGTTINGGQIYPNGVGSLTLRATIKNGATPTTDFVQEFVFSVVKGHVPVRSITLDDIGQPRVGQFTTLNAIVTPTDATNTVINWRVKNAGATGATISAGNIITFTGTGNCVVQAVIRNGLSKTTDFVKEFSLTVRSKFIAVSFIDGFPSEIPYYEDVDGFPLTAVVKPDNADHKTIIYTISSEDQSGLSPFVEDGRLKFNSKSMTHETETSIVVRMVIKDGLSEGVDYITESAIAITPPMKPEDFQPVVRVEWSKPSILRAFRPIKIDDSRVVPDRASKKLLEWKVKRAQDIGGCSAIYFQNTAGNHDDLQANGVHFDDAQYGWSDPETDPYKGNYLYPMSNGKLEVKLEIQDAIDVDVPFEETQILDILDPFIPVKDITNVPAKIYGDRPFCLSPELDTGYGMDDQTAEWDDRVPTFSEMRYTITDGTNVATINANGTITPKTIGSFNLRVTVPSGVQEAYTWHKLQYEETDSDEIIEPVKFEQKDFVKDFTIQVASPENATKRLLTVRKKNSLGGTDLVYIYKKADFDLLRSIGDPEATIPLKGVATKRSAITEIYFDDDFNLTDLSNFGRNFTSLTKINRIPASAKNLRNFLMGCTEFNQSIAIPKGVTGDRCLEGFLRGCTSFNKKIIIPSGVNGNKCLESFLRGCSSFDQSIKLPEELVGDCCMYSFLQDCLAFNSTIILPKKVSGKRCMENVLRNCQNFNQPIKLPDEISGKYNLAAFMFNCNKMTSPVIVPTAACAEGSEHDVITLSTFYRGTAITNGIDIRGPGGDAWVEKTGPQPPVGSPADLLPIRRPKFSTSPAPDISIQPYYGVTVNNNAAANGEFNDFQVGDTVKYMATVINNSDQAINSVVLADTLPAQVTYTSGICTKAEVTVNVVRDPVKYTMKIYEGSGNTSRTEEIQPGQTVTITVADDDQKDSFARWTSNSSLVKFANGTSGSTTFVMPATDVTIKAVYNQEGKYYVEVHDSRTTNDGSGYYSPENTVNLRPNTSDPLYRFDTWTCPDTNQGASLKPTPSGTTFTMPSHHVIVKGTWEITGDIPEKLGVVKSVNASIGKMEIGEEVSLIINAKAATIGRDAASIATVTFAESAQQPDKSTMSSTKTISILETLSN